MPHDPRTPSSLASRVLLWIERGLVAAGIVALATVALLVADSYMAQRTARHALEAAVAVDVAEPDVARPPRPPSGNSRAPTALTPASAPAAVRDSGTPLGELSIPRVRLSAVVFHGSDTRTLRRGPGHIETTALPGENGNVAIAGHRDSFFRPIRHVTVGDDVYLRTGERRFHYRVSSTAIVEATDLSVLASTGGATLTLITCYPFSLIGSAPDRFVVKATAVVDESQGARVERGARREVGSQDEELVRSAIERFRVTYNARLARRPDAGARSLLFRPCDVTVQQGRASAVCVENESDPSSGRPHAWNFVLRRVNEAWALTAVESP